MSMSDPAQTILLVEDEVVVAMGEAALLEEHGYKVVTVHSDTEAIDTIEETHIDLILMDIDLGPNSLSGTETAELILKKHDIPTVFLSSHTDSKTVEKTEGITSYGYIFKNSGETVLLASVRMAFKLFNARQKIAESEKRYRYLYENTLEEVHLWQVIRDSEGNIKTWRLVDVNPAGLKAWRKSLDEVIGKTADEIWPGSDPIGVFFPIVKRIFEEGKPHTWQIYFPGTGQFLLMNSVAFGDYFYSTGVDIKAMKQLEESLQKSEQRLKDAQHIAKLGSWDMDAVSGDGYWSDELFHLLGYEPGAVTASYALFKEHLHPDDTALFDENISDFIRHNREIDTILRFKTRRGETRIAHVLGRVCYTDQGSPIRVYGTFQDITEPKLMEEKHRENEKRLAMIVDNSLDALIVFDRKKEIEYISPAYERLFGYTLEDELGRHVDSIITERIHPDDIKLVSSIVAEAISTKKLEYTCKYRFRHKNGTYIWRFDKTRLLLDEQGNYSRAFVVCSDISELEEREAELVSAIKENRILMNELNHRVNNNLAILRSLISIKDSEIGEAVDLSDIQAQVDAIRLIHEKLYKAGQLDQVQLRDYFEELLDTIFSHFFSHRIIVQNRCERITVPSKAAVSLGLILNELATNAIKHGFTEGQESLFVIDLRFDAGSSALLLTVSNSGQPFPETIRLDNPHTIGLRLISSLTEQMDGTIELQRTPYPTFIFSFPQTSLQ